MVQTSFRVVVSTSAWRSSAGSAPSAPPQGFNQEDLGVVEKEAKAQKGRQEESDSDESLERSGQE